MHYVWKRKDFSGNSKIRHSLLEKLLRDRTSGIMEIPKEYEDMVAAAGTGNDKWNALIEWMKRKEK